MHAERITVGVHPLDQVSLRGSPDVRGWSQRLAEAEPVLADGATPEALVVEETTDGLVLADGIRLSGAVHARGVRVVVEPIPGRAALFLVRLAGKPVAVACPDDWQTAVAQAEPRAWPEGLAAYGAGTLIDTPDGPCPVETLRPGDVVTTLANGSRPLRWVGRRRVPLIELLARPGLRPVTFAPGVMGNARPLTLSQEKRLLIDDWRAEVYFGEDRVLVAAQALVDDQSARIMLPAGGVEYVTLLCDRHEVLLAEGALAESFHPVENGIAALSAAEQAEVEAVVALSDLQRRRAAFPIVRTAEARALRR